MTDVGRSHGRGIGALLWLLVAIWAIGVVLAPLVTMVGRSTWTVDAASMEIAVEVDRLWDELAAARWDWERASDAETRATLDRRIRALTDRARLLERHEAEPRVVYGLDNYARLSGLHARVLLRTLGWSLLATALSLVVCYPVAWAVARAPTRTRAGLILAGLLVPFALAELLRIQAWAMILDPRGLVASALAGLGLIDASAGGAPLLGHQGSVFVAMVYAHVLFMVLPVIGALETLDPQQIDAARDLGASTLRLHARVVLPHARPGLAVGAILTFMLAAGSYSVPQIMTRGQGGDWFAQLMWRRFFESAEWNIGAAYGTTLLLACLAVIFALMRLFRVRFGDLARRGGRHA